LMRKAAVTRPMFNLWYTAAFRLEPFVSSSAALACFSLLPPVQREPSDL
jgi:hypothetical protein